MNKKIVWDQSFETNIPEIDAQHQRLVEIIGALADGIGCASMSDLQTVLAQLKEYAQYHFQAEETIMEASGYADLEAHRDEHMAFVDQLQLFDLDIILASEGLAWDMYHFLIGWLTNHILVVDKKFSTSLPA
ncbi:MAG: hemerythrin family protein [Desulfomicrobium sp.]|nr:hemerythrin family protein [Desulfomicrobium sp.]